MNAPGWGEEVSRLQKRKLIEVALPLEAINRESAREKSIRHGHPSTLHLWWARRPLAAARAVLFAQLVDDPSSHPDKFPTEEAQRVERERLHRIIERLVVWENIRDERLFAEARKEILKSTDGNPPPILDPFAGGGTIPLEAQRLGLEAHASDLNPVAVLINKALIEIPPKFRDQPPVSPGLAESEIRNWRAAEGLAADVRAYGQWIRDHAEQRIGHLYPKATLPDGSKATVIAWIWAQSVTCENPVCRADLPLISSLDLGRKKGREAWLRPIVENGRVEFEVANGPRTEDPNKRGQGAKFICWVCGAPQSPGGIHSQLDQHVKPSPRLLAVVVEGHRRRIYLTPDEEQRAAYAYCATAVNKIRKGDETLSPSARGTFGGNAQGRRYGFFTFADYFTDRQLLTLTTFSDLVGEAREQILQDALATGMSHGGRLEAGGFAAAAYADAVATLLGMAISRTVNKSTAICTWDSSTKMEAVRGLFARQAIQMAWDFAEANILGSSSGNFSKDTEWVAQSLERVPVSGSPGIVVQADAAVRSYDGVLVSTDPPYYDNIGYADLSDFFYVWLRRSLKEVYPDLFSTMLVPKAEELVADSYRHDGKDGAKKFFENGFRDVFAKARKSASNSYPITVYYAFKQSETDERGKASTGWETLLDGMIRAGWMITATWPNRSELGNRMVASGTNALASSIVLALRPRPEDALITDRRGFITALQAELPQALRNLQHGMIAPVDLPQAAIGPGMAVFSRYARVLEADGTPMSVRSALARINEILDQVLNEQEGDFDATTRFAVAWYRQYGYGTGPFGAADSLARARNTSVEAMDRGGVLASRAGKVTLLGSADLPSDYDVLAGHSISAWEAMHHLMRALERDGLVTAGEFLAAAASRPDSSVDTDLVKELAFLLFSVAEKNGRTKDALSFNTLATSWPEIFESSRATAALTGEQGIFDFNEDD
jgi:putative DNA methylase